MLIIGCAWQRKKVLAPGVGVDLLLYQYS